jgi:hypothetical protein
MTALPLPGPQKADCPCGCGTFGTPRRKAWRDGLGAHVRGCPCRRCAGSRNTKKAGARERRVARATGGAREPLSGALSGVDGRSGLWVWEETSNQAITRGFKFWIEGKGVQQKIARMMTKTGVRHALVLSWGEKQIRPKYVVVPYEDWCGLVKESIE